MKKLISLALALIMLLSLSSAALADLIWSDEFDGDTLSADWRVMTGTISANGMNREWSADQVVVSDGALALNGNFDEATNTWKTAAITSANRVTNKSFGYYETRMLVPFHAGSYTFLQMTSERWGGAYNASYAVPTHGFQSTIIKMQNSPYNIHAVVGENYKGGAVKDEAVLNKDSEVNIFDGQYHTFGYEWTKEKLNYYIDGVLVHTVDGLAIDATNGFNTNQYPGTGTSTWFDLVLESQGWSGLGQSYMDTSDVQILVDYIRYYDAKPVVPVGPKPEDWIGHTGHTVSLAGLSMKDLGISSDWQNIVPVDLTKDATYTYPLVVADWYYIGNAIVTVSGGVPTVELKYVKNDPTTFSLNITSEKIKWFTDFEQVNARGMRSAAAEVDFTGVDTAYLYIANKATWMYQYGAGVQLGEYWRNTPEMKAYRAELMTLIPTED